MGQQRSGDHSNAVMVIIRHTRRTTDQGSRDCPLTNPLHGYNQTSPVNWKGS